MKLIKRKVFERIIDINCFYQQLQGHYILYGEKYFDFPEEFQVKIERDIIRYFTQEGKEFMTHHFRNFGKRLFLHCSSFTRDGS